MIWSTQRLGTKLSVMPPIDDYKPPKFRIQKKRLGRIVRFVDDKHFGFIDAEDFREDVFFHADIFEPVDLMYTYDDGGKVGMEPVEGLWVEFEVDDEHWDASDKLRAKVVRPSNRPGDRKMTGRDATFKIVTHHPNARRKRPTWRDKDA